MSSNSTEVRAYTLRRFTMIVEAFAATKDGFLDRMDADPLDALSWADRFVEAAAEAKAAERIVMLINDNIPLDTIIDDLRRDVISKSRSLTTSTSPFANAVEMKMLNELSRALSKLESY